MHTCDRQPKYGFTAGVLGDVTEEGAFEGVVGEAREELLKKKLYGKNYMVNRPLKRILSNIFRYIVCRTNAFDYWP